MLGSMLNKKININKELQAYMESHMEEMSELHKKAIKGDLMDKVNLLFEKKSENWIEEIQIILNKQEYFMQKNLSDKALALDKLCNIYNQENKMNSIFSKVSSLEELMWVYKKTVFSIRRIELFKEENGDSLIKLVEQWNFTEEYVMEMLESTIVHNKINTYLKLIPIFTEHGYSSLCNHIFRRLEQYAK